MGPPSVLLPVVPASVDVATAPPAPLVEDPCVVAPALVEVVVAALALASTPVVAAPLVVADVEGVPVVPTAAEALLAVAALGLPPLVEAVAVPWAEAVAPSLACWPSADESPHPTSSPSPIRALTAVVRRPWTNLRRGGRKPLERASIMALELPRGVLREHRAVQVRGRIFQKK